MKLRFWKDLPHTFIHSDVHLGNWYKTGDGRMGLCDWQCCNVGSPFRDVAYAISTTLAIDDRRAWESDLLKLYLSELGRVSGHVVSYDVALLEYRRFLVAALMMWTPTLCPAPNFPSMQPEEMSMTMIERITAAIDDHDSVGSCSSL